MQQRALVKLYLNRCQCAIKLAKWDQAITYSNKVLEIEPKNHKALYRYSNLWEFISCKHLVSFEFGGEFTGCKYLKF